MFRCTVASFIYSLILLKATLYPYSTIYKYKIKDAMDVIQQADSGSMINNEMAFKVIQYYHDFSLPLAERIHQSFIFHEHPFVNWNKVLEASVRTEIPIYKIVRRVIDIVISLLVIFFILSWLIPIMAICIKFDSTGPVFFLQKRKGYNGKIFNCIKFRSMYLNEQSDSKPVEENDTRITPFGNFLRRYYLDELPQFINVLTGSMTIVGPRPHMISENDYYEDVIKNYSYRYNVKPGITGLGQVNNHYNISSRKKMEQRIFWDTLYIKNWSEQLDLWIIYKTFFYCFQSANNFQPRQTFYESSSAKI